MKIFFSSPFQWRKGTFLTFSATVVTVMWRPAEGVASQGRELNVPFAPSDWPLRGISPSDWPGGSRVTGAQRQRRITAAQTHCAHGIKENGDQTSHNLPQNAPRRLFLRVLGEWPSFICVFQRLILLQRVMKHLNWFITIIRLLLHYCATGKQVHLHHSRAGPLWGH